MTSRQESERNQHLGAIEDLHRRVVAIAGADQALLHHGDLRLALGQDALEVLHHAAERETCLLKRAEQALLAWLAA